MPRPHPPDFGERAVELARTKVQRLYASEWEHGFGSWWSRTAGPGDAAGMEQHAQPVVPEAPVSAAREN